MTTDIQRVKKYCERWDIRVVGGDEPKCPVKVHGAFYAGPQAGGLWHDVGVIWWPDYAWRTNGFSLLHELSHAIQELRPGIVSEVDSSMIAFEYYSGRFLHLNGWSLWMEEFGTPNGLWPGLSIWQRSSYIDESLIVACSDGILTKQGKPTFKRK